MEKPRLSIAVILFICLVAVVAAAGACRAMAGDSAALPAAGTEAPDFTMLSHEEKQVSLRDFRGQWVVLYFYPKNFTPGCTIEAHNFKENMDKFHQRRAVVLGVSVDTAQSHKDFCTKEGLNFLLLSDADRSTSKAYGSLMSLGPIAVSARNSFIIDPDGRIAKVFKGVKPARHCEEVLAALDELQKEHSKQ